MISRQGRKEPDEEEEEPEEAALDLDQVVRVNVDGQPAEVSLQEALNGYVRAETFHRRLNQLGQVAQEIEKERAELAQARDYYAQMIPALISSCSRCSHRNPTGTSSTRKTPEKLPSWNASGAPTERRWGSCKSSTKGCAKSRSGKQQRQKAVYEDTQRRKLARLSRSGQTTSGGIGTVDR